MCDLRVKNNPDGKRLSNLAMIFTKKTKLVILTKGHTLGHLKQHNPTRFKIREIARGTKRV